MTEIAKAYVQLVPTTKGIGSQIESSLSGEMSGAGKSAGDSWAAKFISTAKRAIAAAGLGKIIKEAISAGADYQQNVGGIETLFGAGGAKSVEEYAAQVGKCVEDVTAEYETLHAAEERMMTYANEAYSSAGLSANDYMQTVTGFAASLKQSVGGDMEELTSVANMAVVDMADNANKMGTDMQSIQNAYQGFAKQNYTMLDNLKLGYNGNQSEMERLLAHASEISGIEYNIDNLSDVYNAIHVIQEELGITGTTAQEAEKTFSGSFASMKAAATNVLTAWSVGGDVEAAFQTFSGSLQTFVTGNLVPMISNILTGIPELLSGVADTIVQYLNIASDHSGELVDYGIEIVTALIEGITASAPDILASGLTLVTSLAQALLDHPWIETATTLVENIGNGIMQFAGESFGADSAGELISAIVTGLYEKASELMSSGTSLVNELSSAISSNLPTITENAIALVNQLVSDIASNAPMLLDSASELLTSIVSGITENLPTLAASAVTIVSGLLDAVIENAPDIIPAAVEMLAQLAVGLVGAIPDLLSSAISIVTGLKDHIVANKDNILSAGKEMLIGIKDGIANAIPDLAQAALDIVTNLKNFIVDKASNLWEAGKSLVSGLFGGKDDSEGEEAGEGTVSGFLSGVVSKAGEVISSGAEIAGNVIGGVASKTGEFISSAASAVGSFIDGFGGNESEVTEAGAGLITSAIDGITQNSETILSSAASVVTSLATGISNTMGPIMDAGQSLIDTLLGKVTESADSVIVTAETVMNNFITGIENKYETISECGRQIVTDLKTAVEGKYSDMYSAGGYLITGLWNGISDKEGWIKSQISSYVGRIISQLKSEFGINSPSKVTYWMGEMLAEGLAKGMTDKAYRVDEAWNGLSAGLTPAIATAGAYGDSAGSGSGGVQIVQNISAVPQTPVEFASATLSYFQQARWA